MAMVTKFDDALTGESISLYDASLALLKSGSGVKNSLGSPGSSPRTITLSPQYNPSRNMTREQTYQAVNAATRMLLKATTARMQGLGRIITMTVQLDALSVPTVFDVLGGSIPVDNPWDQTDLINTRLNPTLSVDVEPLGRSAEVTLLSTGVLYGLASGITYHFLNHTGATVFGTNNVGRVEGSLWQSDRLTTSPTLRTPQNGDILYWGNDLTGASTGWDRIVMGIRTPRTGTITGVWEYSAGSGTWTAFTPTSTFRSGGVSTEFDTAANLGEISWAGQTLTGWANNTVNGVAALWIRYRITAFTSMPQVPVMMNGMRSHFGVGYVPASSVKGDTWADALVSLKNNSGGNDLGGFKSCIATGLGSNFMPPFVVEWEAADLYVPTSGDVSVATSAPTTPFAASGGSDVAVTVGISIASATDRAQHFSGGQYVTAAVSSGDKIDGLGNGAFIAEVLFKLDTGFSNDPMPLITRWTGTKTTKVWGLWVDQGRLRGQCYSSGGDHKVVNGTTDLVANQWYLATYEFKSSSREQRIYLNAVQEASSDTVKSSLRTGQTTALRVGVSTGFQTSDAKDGNSAEVPLTGTVSYVWISDNSISEIFGGPGHYYDSWNASTRERLASDDSAATNTLLWSMNDNAGTTTILDTGAGTAKNGTRTIAPTFTNDAANVKLGYYASGVQVKALGIRLPQTYGQEYPGNYRVLMACSPPSSGFTDVTQLTMSLQFGVGDISLPMSTPPRQFPDVSYVRANSRYYLIDFGVVTLPPAALYEGHRSSDSARNFMQCYLYVNSLLPSATVFYVDCLYFLPTDTWYGDYQSFRDTIVSAYNVQNQESVNFDGRGPELVIAQTTSAGVTAQDRNQYAKWISGPPKLYPQRPAWLFAMPEYPEDLTNDSPTRIGLNQVVPRLTAIPRWYGPASA
jgi:hypothetical protein